MRFFIRALVGFVILALCAGTLAYGVKRYSDARTQASQERPKKPAPERVYTVSDLVLEPTTATPVMTAYGTVQAGRTLELRAAQPGRIVDMARNFRNGVEIAAGEMLLRIDPADTRSREADALAGLADARSREAQAAQSVSLARAELSSAQAQANLRKDALKRQVGLANRGVAARVTVETAQIALVSAQQAVISRQQALANAEKQLEQARLVIERADISVSTTRRDLSETAVVAPYAGVLTETSAALGRLVSSNETLGRLIDLNSLEVAFRLSDQQFARVLDGSGRLLSLKAEVWLSLGDRKIETDAVLDRIAATTQTEGGRTVYATISGKEGSPLRPGDFVSIRITEPPLQNVAEIPARAATEDGRIFIIGDDNRLSVVTVKVMRRLADSLIIADAPFGQRIVAELRPQLGPGIKVQNFEEAKIAQEEEKKAAAERRKRRAARAISSAGGKSGGPPEGGGRPGKGESGGRPEGGGKPDGTGRGEGKGKGEGRGEGGGRPGKPEAKSE